MLAHKSVKMWPSDGYGVDEKVKVLSLNAPLGVEAVDTGVRSVMVEEEVVEGVAAMGEAMTIAVEGGWESWPNHTKLAIL